MAGTIFTPTTLWNDFNNASIPVKELIYSMEKDGVLESNFFINGLIINGEKVAIFAKLYKNAKLQKSPVIFLLNSFDGKNDKPLIDEFLKNDYSVCVIDFLGNTNGVKYYTTYPNSFEHAKYNGITNGFYQIDGEVKESPWYIWGAMAKYTVRCLAQEKEFTKIGIFAYGECATLGWITSATEEDVDCSAFIMNSGWANYRKHFRYSIDTDIQIGSWEMKYIAGFDPQTYAQHIKKPVLLLSATNSIDYDVDRAYTTISRIDPSIYSAVDYSIGLSESIDYNGYKELIAFYSVFLKRETDKGELPLDLTISASQDEDGLISIEVKTREDNIDNLSVYYSENELNPALRTYSALKNGEQIGRNSYLFKLNPNSNVENLILFVKMKLKNGFSSCSDIIYVKNSKFNGISTVQYNVLYSNKVESDESVFTPAIEKNTLNCVLDINNENEVVKTKGVKGIYGIYSKNGIKTNKVGAKTCKLKEDSLLMFDVCSKDKCELKIKINCDICGANKEFSRKIELIGGNVWQNIKLQINRLKDENGQAIKEDAFVNSLSLISDSKAIFNGIIIL